MSSIDLASLVRQVEALTGDANATPAPTGDTALDAALMDLRDEYGRRGSGDAQAIPDSSWI